MLNPRFSPMEDAMANLPWTRLEDPDELDAEETENLEEVVVDAPRPPRRWPSWSSKSPNSTSW